MRVTFVSNYINHHQLPFCEAMYAVLGRDFVFLQTEAMEEERRRMGWEDMASELPYVRIYADDCAGGRALIQESDIVLAGWAPKVAGWVSRRAEQGRPVFYISERLYKDGQWKAISPRGLVAKYQQYTRFRSKPCYLLSAGAYVGSDFSLIHAFPDRKFVWGYFPPFREYTRNELAALKQEGQRAAAAATGRKAAVELIWAGRFVDFKHPELLLRLAADLRSRGVSFHLSIAGGGDGEEAYRKEIEQQGLEAFVTLHGLTSPDNVRRLMERSLILVFPSDRGEGWGAVVNEAMNSGCAIVADAEAGCVPWLVQSGVNGYIANGRDYEDLLAKTQFLAEHPVQAERFGMAGYRAIREQWNAANAAARLLNACECVMAGHSPAAAAPAGGPMSVDPCMKPYMKVPHLNRH